MVNGYMPEHLQEALQIRAEKDVIPYGGGTDLMIHGDESAVYLFVNRVEEMRQICVDQEFVRIGGSCTFHEVLQSPFPPALLKEAVSRIAAPAIRNLGTMAGNIGNGSAKADTVLIEFAADAKLRLASTRGERVVPIRDFYQGRKKLDLAKDELIVEILLPKAGLADYYYEKVGARDALAISRVSFAGILQREGEISRKISAAFGAVADTVLRFPELEQKLYGRTRAEVRQMKAEWLQDYAEAIRPTRGRVSAEYRKAVCLNLLGAFLEAKGM